MCAISCKECAESCTPDNTLDFNTRPKEPVIIQFQFQSILQISIAKGISHLTLHLPTPL